MQMLHPRLMLYFLATAIAVATACSRGAESIAVGPGKNVMVFSNESIEHPLPAGELKRFESVFNTFPRVDNPLYRTIVGPNYRLYVSVLLPDSGVAWNTALSEDTAVTVLATTTTKFGTSVLFRRGDTLAAIVQPTEFVNPSITLCYLSPDSSLVRSWFTGEKSRQRISNQ
jgi:hypothetical protein